MKSVRKSDGALFCVDFSTTAETAKRAAACATAREQLVYVRIRRAVMFLLPGIRELTAAARQDQKSDDDDPDAVVVIEKIAEAVIHGISSVSES